MEFAGNAMAAGILAVIVTLAGWMQWHKHLRNAVTRRPLLMEKRGAEDLNDVERSRRVEYHNNAIYRDLGIFIRVSLAIIGGAAFVGMRDQSVATIVPALPGVLLFCAGVFQAFLGVFTALAVYSHQESKIAYWPKPPKPEQVREWLEWRVMPIIAFVSSFVAVFLVLIGIAIISKL